ncbi:DUF6377 domain-containing protein [Christiangramia crocea]|uniref:DUF6377 domain-containing protein n=1 Tax=Christiangramia crocea TaxID=2904124 RepID=A0A9X1UUN9_9FLAO|nr:DUF6377 domain-containing protein [Gramella crocea]
MKRLIPLLFLIILPFITAGQENIIEDLKIEIERASIYDLQKLERIDSLRGVLSRLEKEDIKSRYELNRKLFEEYQVFKRDSAFAYGIKTRELAEKLGDTALTANAVFSLADISVSAGMYKEALEFMEIIEPDEIPPHMRSLYFGLLGRCYGEMAEYSDLPYFSSEYRELATRYRKNALELTDKGTFFNSFLKGFMSFQEEEDKTALEIYNDLLTNELNYREAALVHFMLGSIYMENAQNDKAITHLAKSAIFDIKTSTKENLSMLRLAELMFEKDDIRNASTFIKKANADALFFGAQQRKISVGAILPLIEEKIVQRIERQRERLYWQNIFMGVLLVFVIGLAIVIYSQVNKLKKAKKIITEAHENLQATNEQIVAVNEKIRSTNAELIKVNNQLLEANKIKEEYIGFFFTQDADIFEKFRSFKIAVEKSLNENNYEKARYLVSNYNLKKEKQKLLENFDEAFIKLFPNFIEEFNSLLKPNEKIKVKKGQLLNKELRIFALIRLGINHNEIIAQILGYSVNSIYAYKTKIRKKSLVDTRDFDEKLLNNTTLKL